MIERTTGRSRITLPVLEGTQRHIKSLRELPGMAAEFDLMGDPTPLKILLSLAHAGDLCVSDLADILEMGTSAISHQLRKLRDGDLIQNRRDGSVIYYRLNSETIRERLNVFKALLEGK